MATLFAAAMASAAPRQPLSIDHAAHHPILRNPAVENDGRAFYPLSWLHWWEMYRFEYVRPAWEAHHPLEHQDALAVRQAATTRAAGALLASTHSPLPSVRAAAALALGRLRHAPAVDRLIALTGDPERQVAWSAWVALGLLGSPEAVAFLTQHGQLDVGQTLAWLSAVAVMDDPPANVLAAVRYAAEKAPVMEERRMAVWVLRVHPPPDFPAWLRDQLFQTPDPGVALEIIQALGDIADPQDKQLLLDIYRGTGAWSRSPAFAAARPTAAAAGPRAVPYAAGALWALRHDGALMQADRDDLCDLIRSELLPGVVEQTRTHKTRLDTMGKVVRSPPPVPWSGAKPPGPFEVATPTRLDDDWLFLQGPGLLTLGHLALGRPQDISLLKDGLNRRSLPTTDDYGRAKPWDITHHPTRAFCALALGHVLRAIQDHRGQEPDPKQVRPYDPDALARQISQLLEEHVRLDRNPDELRAACALALGLSRMPENAPRLIAALEAVRGDGELVTAYGLLGLALLGEPQTVVAASKCIGPPRTTLDLKKITEHGVRPIVDPVAVVARRNVALALATLGRAQAAPALIGEWGWDYWISLEAARALGWCGDYTTVDDLIALTASRDPQHEKLAALATASLGEMLDPDRPSRLDRLIRGGDFSLRGLGSRWLARSPTYSAVLGPSPRPVPDFHALGQPFLLRYLRRLSGESFDAAAQDQAWR